MSELDLFTAALALADRAERAAFLDRGCADNPGLRRRLDELLAGHAAGSFIEPAAGERTGAYVSAAADRAEDQVASVIVGKYKLLQLVCEGGMGAVYMAD